MEEHMEEHMEEWGRTLRLLPRKARAIGPSTNVSLPGPLKGRELFDRDGGAVDERRTSVLLRLITSFVEYGPFMKISHAVACCRCFRAW
jgi:hypothetical protein